jgi:hypothetical protein
MRPALRFNSPRQRLHRADFYRLNQVMMKESRLVDDQHPVGVARVLGDVGHWVVARRVGAPVGAGEGVLHAMGPAPACSAGCRPPFRSTGLGRPLRDSPARRRGLGAGEVLAEPAGHEAQLVGPAPDRLDRRED